MELIKTLRLLGDTSRLRILRLLAQEELSVADLQDILGMGQSRISMQLSQLRQAGIVEARKSGQKSLYRLAPAGESQPVLEEILARTAAGIPEAAADDEGLRLALDRRRDHLRAYFDELAGRFGRSYVPGRSWKALSETLIRLLPPLDIVDIGAGEGTLALMLARTARRVIAVDSSERMVEYGRALVEKHGLANVEYRLGDMEDLPLSAGEADLALFHQSLHHALHPGRALAEANRVLRTGGRAAILDLLRHDFEGARELYGDLWPGFSLVDLSRMLSAAGFTGIDVAVVDRSSESPHFETVLATGRKP